MKKIERRMLICRGLAFVRLGRQAEAVGMFARAAQVATNDVVRTRCIFEQAEALRADGRFAEAAMAYGAIVEGELRPQARLRQAESLLRAERPQEAERLFRALVKEGGEPAVEASLRIASLEARPAVHLAAMSAMAVRKVSTVWRCICSSSGFIEEKNSIISLSM